MSRVKGDRDLRLSEVRYGNVLGSRGSVIPFFLDKRDENELPITDERMTRFSISLEAGVELVIKAVLESQGGEIYVPKLPSYKITDVAEAIAPRSLKKIVGIRPGEKVHEDMITTSDSQNTLDFGDVYVIHPSTPKWLDLRTSFIDRGIAREVGNDFSYNSGHNDNWMTISDIREAIKQFVDPTFLV